MPHYYKYPAPAAASMTRRRDLKLARSRIKRSLLLLLFCAAPGRRSALEMSPLAPMLGAASTEGPMDHADVERLRDRHPAWRLLRAANAPLVLAFPGRFFVEDNNGVTSASVLAAALDDVLYALNAPDPATPRYPKPATEYLEDWAHADAGWLRRFNPLGSDEAHYDATPALGKAYGWVTGLAVRAFVGRTVCTRPVQRRQCGP
jgi:hypothetical protein